MSYDGVKYYSHGDTVAAVDIQNYSDALNYMHGLFPTEKISWAQPYSQMEDTQTYYIVHRRRWLLYVSTGEIAHPTDPDTYPGVSLSDTGGVCAVDVDQTVDWLVPGQLYKVVGCSVAFEDDEGILT